MRTFLKSVFQSLMNNNSWGIDKNYLDNNPDFIVIPTLESSIYSYKNSEIKLIEPLEGDFWILKYKHLKVKIIKGQLELNLNLAITSLKSLIADEISELTNISSLLQSYFFL